MVFKTKLKGGESNGTEQKTKPIDEAVQQYLGKQTKLETAADAIFTKSFHHLDMDELDTVRRYREDKLFSKGNAKGTPQGPANNDLLVADNVNIYEPQPNRGWLPAAVVLAAAMAMMATGFWAMNPNRLMPSPPVVGGPDADTQYNVKPLPGE